MAWQGSAQEKKTHSIDNPDIESEENEPTKSAGNR